VKTLRIGSRGSALAAWQAQHIAAKLSQFGTGTEIVYIKTSGDRMPEAGINQFGVKGVFIKEIEDALLGGQIDFAVHSMKDVPTDTPAGLAFPAICEREDVRDALISAKGVSLAALPTRSRVGTSSLRRQAQLRRARPDLELVEMRGNVDTRLKKLDRGECDAIVLAKAGLDRLGLTSRISEVLSTDVCLPAVGQGALAIEARAADAEIMALLGRLDHRVTRAAVTAERALLREVEGGCQIPLGAWAWVEGENLVLDACIASLQGEDYIRTQVSGPLDDADGLGRRAAHELLAAGAGRILKLLGRQVAGD
jgi:hydroxymethylbilane synthase